MNIGHATPRIVEEQRDVGAAPRKRIQVQSQWKSCRAQRLRISAQIRIGESESGHHFIVIPDHDSQKFPLRLTSIMPRQSL